MPVDDILLHTEEKMQKSAEAVVTEFAGFELIFGLKFHSKHIMFTI